MLTAITMRRNLTVAGFSRDMVTACAFRDGGEGFHYFAQARARERLAVQRVASAVVAQVQPKNIEARAKKVPCVLRYSRTIPLVLPTKLISDSFLNSTLSVPSFIVLYSRYIDFLAF